MQEAKFRDGILFLDLANMTLRDMEAWLELDDITELYIPFPGVSQIGRVIEVVDEVWERVRPHTKTLREEFFVIQFPRREQGNNGWTSRLIEAGIDPIQTSYDDWVEMGKEEKSS